MHDVPVAHLGAQVLPQALQGRLDLVTGRLVGLLLGLVLGIGIEVEVDARRVVGALLGPAEVEIDVVVGGGRRRLTEVQVDVVGPVALGGSTEVDLAGLVGLGLLCAVLSWVRWGFTERAMRRRGALPGSSASVVLALGLVVVGAVLLFVGMPR